MSCTHHVLAEGERVMEFTAAVGQKFATQMYDSCKDVGMPLIGTKIIGLFCGTSAEVCDTQNIIMFFTISKFRVAPNFPNYLLPLQ